MTVHKKPLLSNKHIAASLTELKKGIHARHSKIIAPTRTILEKGMVQNDSWPLFSSDLQLQEMFVWGYCCQRRVNQLLNPV